MRSIWPALFIALACAFPTQAQQDKTTPVWDKPLPESKTELLEIQQRLQEMVAKTRGATVNILGDDGSGSGVIINETGLILTAGHINVRPDREVTVHFEDGTRTPGITLGASWLVDSGMIQIVDKQKAWPFIEMAPKNSVRRGDWCFALGYPDGFQQDRGVVVRLGRVLKTTPTVIQTDCRLLGGDSGGPLFNMNGQVIGIHSRISLSSDENWHAPIDAFRQDWDRLLEGEVLRELPEDERGFIGVKTQDPEAEEGREIKGAEITDLVAGSPAVEANLQPGDLITKVNNRPIANARDFDLFMRSRRFDETVMLEVQSEFEHRLVEITLIKKPEAPLLEP